MTRSLLRFPLLFALALLSACAGGDAPVAPVVPTPPPAPEPLPPGTLVLSVSGLPEGTNADIAVTGAAFSRPATASVTWNDLQAGRYRIVVRTARGVIGAFAADSTQIDVDIISGGPPSLVNVRYRALPAALDLRLTGLPASANAAVRVQSPSGDTVLVPSSRILTDSLHGVWRVNADTVVSGAARYAPSPAAIDAAVLHGDTAVAAINFWVASGALALSFTGLPSGTDAVSRVEGPHGYVQTVTGTATLTELAPGDYRVITSALAVNGVQYVPDADTLLRTVTASLVAEPAVVHYRAQVGQLALATSGLPDGAFPVITVTGAAGTQTVAGDSTLAALPAGQYKVRAARLTLSELRYAPADTAYDVVINTGDSIALTIVYAVVPTVVDVVISGLPNGANALAVLTSPDNVNTTLSGTARINPAAAGRWRLLVSDVSFGGDTFKPSPASFDDTVSPGDTLRFNVSYAMSTGALSLTIAALPAGVQSQVVLSGPNGYSSSVTSSQTVAGLTPGSYTVTAADVTSSGTSFVPSPRVATVAVQANATSSTTITYSATGPNFQLAQLHLTQATQRYDGGISLVAGRDALLRVFVIASEANSARPDVRVRIYDGATLLNTVLIPAPEQSVRQSVSPTTLSSSWNVIVPAQHMRPGLRVLAELDPAAQLNEVDRSDNVWPRSGTPEAVSVYSVPPFHVRFIPVVTGTLTGNVSESNASGFLESARLMFPLNDISADVRAPFTSSASELQANDGNGAWLTVLSEINTLRATDNAPGNIHYYGVVATTYNSGVAGYGYLPGRAAIGWDKMPSGDGVAAHEWGHNFGVFHAPCGTTGDPRYPYADANIGQVGWNVMSNSLVEPTAKDLMSYCSNNWISDFTWSAVMQYRGTSSMLAASSATAAGSTERAADGLLVWGRVIDGRIVLEPAFRVRAPHSPNVQGTHRVALLDQSGASLAEVGVVATRVDHVDTRDERHFAVVLPFSSALAERVASIRVRDVRSPLLTVSRASNVRAQLTALEQVQRSAPQGAQQGSQQSRAALVSAVVDPVAQLRAASPIATRVSWSNRAYNMAMVRDAQSGAIMGFVRRSGEAVVTNGRAVEVVFSDGVRSEVRR